MLFLRNRRAAQLLLLQPSHTTNAVKNVRLVFSPEMVARIRVDFLYEEDVIHVSFRPFPQKLYIKINEGKKLSNFHENVFYQVKKCLSTKHFYWTIGFGQGRKSFRSARTTLPSKCRIRAILAWVWKILLKPYFIRPDTTNDLDVVY